MENTLPPIPRGMFKFRKTLVNSLWSYVQYPQDSLDVEETSVSYHEAAVISGDECRPLQPQRSSSSASSTCQLPAGKKKQLNHMLMRLKKSNLEILLDAIKSQGSTPGGCVLMPASASTTSGIPAHLLLIQVFRWPDLNQESELKRLPFCEFYNVVSDGNATKNLEKKASTLASAQLSPLPRLYECCNPYHWSRLHKQPEHVIQSTDAILTQQRLTADAFILGSEEFRSTPSVSLATCGSTSGVHQQLTTNHGQSWCQLAYWEECQRVGHLIPVSSSSIEIFSALPKSKDGLCLKSLFKENKRPSESTTRTREKIGQGILLIHSDAEGLWVYNRTQSPIFVNSPTLEPPPNILQNNSGASDRITTSSSSTTDSNNYPFTVIKVLPGYSIQIFDYQKSALYEQIRPAFHGPFDPYSVRISFAKGWGGKYSRQVVTNCPCWLEVLLMTPTR